MTRVSRKEMGLIQEKKIKLTLEMRCEWCEQQFPFSSLLIHPIKPPTSSRQQPSLDPQKTILILCITCHKELQEIPLPYHIQKDLIKNRPLPLRPEIQRILNYTPCPYFLPETTDFAEIYEECFSLRSLDLFRVGG